MIIVRPKKPFLDWANGVDDEHNDFTQKEMEDDCAVFLIEDYEEDREKEEILKKQHKEIFEAALSAIDLSTGKNFIHDIKSDNDNNYCIDEISRLINFYKIFGLVENKGRNKDFETSKTMYREPNELV